MAEGKQRDDWNHTADLQATVAEPNRDREKRKAPFGRLDFHPFLQRDEERRKKRDGVTAATKPVEMIPVSVLCSVFVKGGK